jgi:hypothetical protein
MDTEPEEETSENPNVSESEPSKEPPLLKLRDLRPEKDPIGAGRNRRPTTGAEDRLR